MQPTPLRLNRKSIRWLENLQSSTALMLIPIDVNTFSMLTTRARANYVGSSNSRKHGHVRRQEPFNT